MAKTKIERDQLLKSMCEPPSFSIGRTQMDINDDLGLDRLDVNTLFDDQVMLIISNNIWYTRMLLYINYYVFIEQLTMFYFY